MKGQRNIRKFYSMPKAKLTREDSHRLNKLIQLHLRVALLETIYWERSPEPKGGLFTDTMDLYDEADSVIATLQLFGFIPEEEKENPSPDKLAQSARRVLDTMSHNFNMETCGCAACELDAHLRGEDAKKN